MSSEYRLIEVDTDILGKLSPAEQSFFLLLLSKQLIVTYETQLFTGKVNGKESSTKPDFHIINPRHPNTQGKFVEITTSSCPPDQLKTDQDPKFKQRAVLLENGVTHVILYQQHLINCQRYNKQLDFDIKHRRMKKKNGVPKS